MADNYGGGPYQDTYSSYNSAANNDDQSDEPEQFRKLFIGNLNYATTEDTLRSYFSAFGPLVDCVVMKEPKTGKSRGFGFVSYAKTTIVDEVMRRRPHKLDGRELETKRATPREESGKPGSEITTKKLFVGAIKEGLTEDHMREYFAAYGPIADCVIMREKDTNKIRGFGFVEFDDYDPVDKIVLEKYHTINGQSVAVKKAMPKEGVSGGAGPSGGRDAGASVGGGGSRGGRSGRDGSGFEDYAGTFAGMTNLNLGNFAYLAQKLFQTAAMQNFGGNKRMGGAPQRQMNVNDFGGFGGGGSGGGGPMRSGRRDGRSSGPYSRDGNY